VFALFRAMTQTLNGKMEETSQLSRFHVSPSSPIFKGAFQTQLASEQADAAIVETIEWFKRRIAPFFL
jgi:hypothetical protein